MAPVRSDSQSQNRISPLSIIGDRRSRYGDSLMAKSMNFLWRLTRATVTSISVAGRYSIWGWRPTTR